MSKKNNNCPRCGQWAGPAHRCAPAKPPTAKPGVSSFLTDAKPYSAVPQPAVMPGRGRDRELAAVGAGAPMLTELGTKPSPKADLSGLHTAAPAPATTATPPTQRRDFDRECEDHGAPAFVSCQPCERTATAQWLVEHPEADAPEVWKAFRHRWDATTPGSSTGTVDRERHDQQWTRQEMLDDMSDKLGIDSQDLGPKGQETESKAWVVSAARALDVDTSGSKTEIITRIFESHGREFPANGFNKSPDGGTGGSLTSTGMLALRNLIDDLDR